jgi:pyrroloquinoline quinone biosynthesis protein D
MAIDRIRRTTRSKNGTDTPASAQGRLRLASAVQLRVGKGKHELSVLVGPDGDVPLNGSAVAILRLCDGSRSRAEVIAEMVRGAGKNLHVSDIAEFLDAALARHWIVEEW